MINLELSLEDAEILINILGEATFPVDSDECELAVDLFCELNEALDEIAEDEDFCECCGGYLQ